MLVTAFVAACRKSLRKTPYDFFLWGYVKGLVYVPPMLRNINELKIRIRQAVQTFTVDMLHRVWGELDYRLDICRVTRGAHIEHLKTLKQTFRDGSCERTSCIFLCYIMAKQYMFDFSHFFCNHLIYIYTHEYILQLRIFKECSIKS
jgi:hypothetical protein